MDEFCFNLPKIELHAHLNGSLSSETLKTLGALDENIADYKKLTTIIAKSSRTLDDCFTLFAVAHNATKTKEALYTAVQSVIQEFRNENVIYLELRTTPRCEETMSKQAYIETVVEAIDNCDQQVKDDILVKLILSIDRRHEKVISQQALNLFIEMRNKYPNIIKGIDLCGNPNEGEFSSELFERARANGFKTSLHCGEVKNDSEIESILQFKPDRIGHATALHPSYGGNMNLWQMYLTLKIPLECCLTSNVACGTIVSYKEHHLQEWITSSLPFSLATDDKGVFCTTLSKEYKIAAKYFALTETDLWNIAYSSIDYSFASGDDKIRLKTRLEEWKKENIRL